MGVLVISSLAPWTLDLDFGDLVVSDPGPLAPLTLDPNFNVLVVSPCLGH